MGADRATEAGLCAQVHTREPITSSSPLDPILTTPVSHISLIWALHPLSPTGSLLWKPQAPLPSPFTAAFPPSTQAGNEEGYWQLSPSSVSLLGGAYLLSNPPLSTCPAPTSRPTSKAPGSWPDTGRENGALTWGWRQSAHIWLDVRWEGWFNILAGGQVRGDAAPRSHGGCGVPWNR